MAKVFLDPGHGGKDSGAVGNSLQEKNINLSVTLKIGDILKRHHIEVEYSRTTDIFIDLSRRATMANKSEAHIFLSIHCNSFIESRAQGVETYYYPASSRGKILATDIQNSIIDSKAYTRNRGVKSANFTVIAKTTIPAVLVELGFISNIEDSNILSSRQDELAIAVAKGILKNLGIEYIDSSDIVRIDFKGKKIEVNGFMKDDVNYVQVRDIFEKLGYRVEWDNTTQFVIIKEWSIDE